jgi:dihydroxyacetone kinase-like protein
MVGAVTEIDQGAGTLFIVKNYEGDVMNFEMAADMAETPVTAVVVDDDVAVEKSTYSTGRRGVAGTMIVERIVGAAAEAGASLDEALTSCTVPAAGKPTFALGEDEMEMGVGIHGEPGRRRVKLAGADAIADELLGAALGDLSPKAGAETILLVNGFGGTPLVELYLMCHAANRVLAGRKVKPVRTLVGSYATSLEMAGCSLTVSLVDERLLQLWDSPIHTAALRWGL